MAEKIQTLTLDNLKSSFTGDALRMGDDLLYVEQFTPYRAFPRYFHTPAPALTLMETGTTKWRIDTSYVEAQAPFLSLRQPYQRIEIIEQSPDMSGRFLMFSEEYGHQLIDYAHIGLVRSFTKHPVVQLDAESLTRVKSYLDALGWMLRDTDNPFQKDGLQHMTRSLVYMLGKHFITNEEQTLTSQDQQVEKFLQLARRHSGHERRIEFYAEQIGVSPHHLSDLVKEATGATAGWWLVQFSVLEAKMLLSTTKLTISQISDRMQFGDSATFGKFFRRHTGMTPSEFRLDEANK